MPGYAYLTRRGFGSPCDDYFQMVLDSEGLTQLAFGERPSYAGRGNFWVSHQLWG